MKKVKLSLLDSRANHSAISKVLDKGALNKINGGSNKDTAAQDSCYSRAIVMQ